MFEEEKYKEQKDTQSKKSIKKDILDKETFNSDLKILLKKISKSKVYDSILCLSLDSIYIGLSLLKELDIDTLNFINIYDTIDGIKMLNLDKVNNIRTQRSNSILIIDDFVVSNDSIKLISNRYPSADILCLYGHESVNDDRVVVKTNKLNINYFWKNNG